MTGEAETIVGDAERSRADHSPALLRRGTTLGRYVVMEKLGSGGMGVVYAAFDPELDRKIALKLVHAGGHGATGPSHRSERSDGASRLIREAQAMAKLHHPNVIVVHDVGTFEDQVFIAMEYLDDGTLKTWADEASPGWREVVRRFVVAGRGLEAAHAAGIVHRDFKPENVLLGRDGRICVVDFGLARAVSASEIETMEGARVRRIDPTDSLGVRLTQTGAVMGTPAYMAPEQHEGGATDTRTDQFSFCVALYEALYGRRPFHGDSLASLAINVLSGEFAAPPEKSSVPRWINAVLARGLEVDPDDRYPSMTELLSALGRDPRAPRRRWAVRGLGATVVGGSLLGSWFIATSEDEDTLAQCTGAQAQMDEVWGDAQREHAALAFDGSGFEGAQDTWRDVGAAMDEYAADWISMHTEACEATRVRQEQSQELLDRRLICLERARRQVSTLAELFAAADAKLVPRSQALVGKLMPLRDCADIDRLTSSADQPEAGQSERILAAWARIDEVGALRDAARLDDAETRLLEMQAEVEAIDFQPLTARHLYLRAATAMDHQRMEEAERLGYEAAVACAEANFHGLEAESWIGLVRIIGISRRRFAEVQPLVKAAEAAIARAKDKDYYQGGLDSTLGTVEILRGNLTEAQHRLENGLRLTQAHFGMEHPRTLETMEMLALTRYMQEHYDEAELTYRELIEIHDRVSGPKHPAGASARANLGLVYAARGDDEKALETYLEAHAVLEEAYGKHQVLGTSHMNISNTYKRLGNLDKAEAHLLAGAAIEAELFEPDNPRIADNHHAFGQLARLQGRHEEAVERYEKAISIYETTLGREHAKVAYPLVGLAETRIAQGRASEAVRLIERAITLRVGAEAVPTSEMAFTKFRLAMALRASGEDPERAETMATQARETYAGLEGRDEQVADIDAWLAEG